MPSTPPSFMPTYTLRRDSTGDRPVWSPTNLGSMARRNRAMMPQMTMREMALEKFRVMSSTTAQGTITVPAPTMGIKSSTASPRASSRP